VADKPRASAPWKSAVASERLAAGPAAIRLATLLVLPLVAGLSIVLRLSPLDNALAVTGVALCMINALVGCLIIWELARIRGSVKPDGFKDVKAINLVRSLARQT
jgi:hypothetical protein